MNRVPPRFLTPLAGTVLLVLGGACTDGPVAANRTPAAVYGSLSTEYECRVDVRAESMECGLAPQGEGNRAPQLDLLLLGAQAKAVVKGGPTFSRGNPANPDTLTYSLAVLNLLPQAIGTTDGVTAASTGTRIVIVGYTQTNANATLDNADGTATFIDSAAAGGPYTFPNRQYISYPGVLAPNDTSQAKTLRFVYDPVVTTLAFKYRISTVVQYTHGVIIVSPASAPVLAPGQTASLSGAVYDVGGTMLADGVVWSSSDPGVATVNASSGQVTAVHEGTAAITATSTTDASRTGARVVTVDELPAVTGTSPGDTGPIFLSDPILIDFTELVNVSSSTFTIECPTGSSRAFTVSGSGTSTITLDPVSDLPVGTTCTVTVIAAQVRDADALDGPDTMAADYTFSLDVVSFP